MPRILVVEDEPELRSLLAESLRSEGWEVEIADDGIPALQAHATQPVDLIVLDLMLPRMDGFQVLQALRNQNDDVSVLLLTARGDEPTRVRGFDLGTDDYIVKPFSILELMGRMRAILRRVKKLPPPRIQRRSRLYSQPSFSMRLPPL